MYIPIPRSRRHQYPSEGSSRKWGRLSSLIKLCKVHPKRWCRWRSSTRSSSYVPWHLLRPQFRLLHPVSFVISILGPRLLFQPRHRVEIVPVRVNWAKSGRQWLCEGALILFLRVFCSPQSQKDGFHGYIMLIWINAIVVECCKKHEWAQNLPNEHTSSNLIISAHGLTFQLDAILPL